MPGEADGCGREYNGDPAYPHPGKAGYDQASYGHQGDQGDQGGYPQDGDDPEGYGEPLAQVAADPLEYVAQDTEHTIETRPETPRPCLSCPGRSGAAGSKSRPTGSAPPSCRRCRLQQPPQRNCARWPPSSCRRCPPLLRRPPRARLLLPRLGRCRRPRARNPACRVRATTEPRKTRPAVRADVTACGNASDGGWWWLPYRQAAFPVAGG